jgi:hypothetical protein
MGRPTRSTPKPRTDQLAKLLRKPTRFSSFDDLGLWEEWLNAGLSNACVAPRSVTRHGGTAEEQSGAALKSNLKPI